MDDESLIEFRKLARESLKGEHCVTVNSVTTCENETFQRRINARMRSIWWNRFTDAFIITLPAVVLFFVMSFPGAKAKNWFLGGVIVFFTLALGVGIAWGVNYIIALVGKKKNGFDIPPVKNIVILSTMVVTTIALSAFMSKVYAGFLDAEVENKFLILAGATAAVSFLLSYVFVPQYMRRTGVIADLATFAYGDLRDDYDGVFKSEEGIEDSNIKLGYLRTFDVDTTINLDDAMAAMREAIGYSVVREEDTIDFNAFVEDIIVPRMLAMRRRASYDVPKYTEESTTTECNDRIEQLVDEVESEAAKNEGEIPADSESLKELRGFWDGACKPGIFNLCNNQNTAPDLKDALNCEKRIEMAMTFDDFMWKPKGVDPEPAAYAEACFLKCKCDDTCKAAVYENGKCWLKTDEQDWEVDTKADGARVYVKMKKAIDGTLKEEERTREGCELKITTPPSVLPVYETGDAVNAILEDIQIVSPIFDMSAEPDYEKTIRDRLRDLDPEYELNKGTYTSVITALVRESALRSDERTPIQDGGNLKADLETAREYFESKTLHKFNREIAWPVIKAAVNISARNGIFYRIVGRRKAIFLFYHIMVHIIMGGLTLFALSRVFMSSAFSMESISAHPYPKIPFLILMLVFFVSLFVLLERRRLRFNNNVKVQAENAASFGDALRALSNFFSNAEYSQTVETKDMIIVIPPELQDAVFENDMGKAQLRRGSDSTETLDKVFSNKERARLLQKMALVLEEYDKCNNVLYRGGVPFPTALVTAYVGLVVIGIGMLFAVPEINPNRVLGNIDLAKALAEKADDARLAGNKAMVADYKQKLCDLWEETHSKTARLKDVMQHAAVFMSLIFGVIYIVQTVTDASKYAKAVGTGIAGIVGDCV